MRGGWGSGQWDSEELAMVGYVVRGICYGEELAHGVCGEEREWGVGANRYRPWRGGRRDFVHKALKGVAVGVKRGQV